MVSGRSLQCQEYIYSCVIQALNNQKRREVKAKQDRRNILRLELGLGWRLVRVKVRSKVKVRVRVIVGLRARSRVTVTVTVNAGVMVRADT